ncbi:MAG: topoisomerase DNA-binding C4 zinc finger domain-containing protein [Hyphomonas sp.]
MSITKRIRIEKDPAYKAGRKARHDETKTYLEPFSHRLGLRKFCEIEGRKQKDITWPKVVSEAADELAADRVIVNDSMLFISRSVREAVRRLAREKHVGLFEKYGLKPPKRCPKCNEKMRIRLARAGRNSGKHFWGCSGFPACGFTEACPDEQNDAQREYHKARLQAPRKQSDLYG